MPKNDRQPINEHFPPEWEEEIKTQITQFLSHSNCLFAGELEDCTNELFQETAKRYIRYVKDHGEASVLKPENYIRKIARNVCLDFVNQRKKKLAREVRLLHSSAQEIDEGSSPIEFIYDEWDQPEQIVLWKETSDHIFSLIKRLPQPHRDVMKFKAEGAQLREIARHTSMTLPNVSKCLQEGQKQLRQILTDNTQKEQIP